MYPHERSLVRELKDDPFVLIGVNSDDLEAAKRAVEENDLEWRSFQNQPEGAKESISGAWAVHAWPTIVVLDQAMKIRYRGHDGEAATEIVRELLER